MQILLYYNLNSHCCTMPESSSIIKSRSDPKEYRLINLKNGLRVLLISDIKNDKVTPGVIENPTKLPPTGSDDGSSGLDESDTTESDYESNQSSDISSNNEGQGRRKLCSENDKKKQAAAALCINVGSFSDPEKIPGLAHFLEHMVFMGSEKYPDENKFDAFIRLHGGYDNACTDCQRTVFYFEIQPGHFRDALDIWAQFFASPLLKQDSVDREVKAVDAEFDMALNADDCRKEQLLASIFPREHPMAKFMWGNKLSLSDKPADMGINVYDELKKFHNLYYSPLFMTLVLQSPESLDTLETWAREIFESIPHDGQTLQNYTENVPTVTPFQLVKIAPVRNIQELQLTWILPPQQKFYKTKPLHYISWLIGHEGKGSILSYLRKKNMALNLCGGNGETGFEQNDTCSLFNITITLTDTGFSQYFKVIHIVFQYLAMLTNGGANETIFREIQKIEDIDFMFQEEETPSENAVKQAGNVLLYPEKDILTGDNLIFEYDPDCINNALRCMKPSNCIYFLSSPSFVNMADAKKEPWFSTQYSIENISNEWKAKWSTYSEMKNLPELHLPYPNKFIAGEFDLKFNDSNADVDHPKYPELISEPEAGYKLWFRQDRFFKLPKAYVRIHLINPLSNQTPQDTVCLELLVHLLIYNLAEVAYDADAASLTYGAEVGEDGGLILKFSGYNDKLPLLIDTVTDYLIGFKTDESAFAQRLLHHTRTYYNTLIKPSKLAKSIRLSILNKFGYSNIDRYQACRDLTFHRFTDFVQKFLSTLYIESLIQGNYSKEEALAIMDKFMSKTKHTKLCENQIIFQRTLRLGEKPKVCKVKALNPSDDNSVITVYFQEGHGTVEKGAILRLLEAIMDEPCFDILRTKQQLGYSVYVQQHDTSGVLGLTVNVGTQNSKFSVEHTSHSVLKFATKEMLDIIENMKSEDFVAQVESLVAILKNDDTHLGEEVDRNWREILSHYYLFDRVHTEIKFLNKCSHSDLQEFFIGLCLKNDKILHVQVQGNSPSKIVEDGENNSTDPKQRKELESDDSSSPPSLQLQFLSSSFEERNDIPDFIQITNIERLKNSSSFYPVSTFVNK
ncbi:nardilysin-like [Styela clava]